MTCRSFHFFLSSQLLKSWSIIISFLFYYFPFQVKTIQSCLFVIHFYFICFSFSSFFFLFLSYFMNELRVWRNRRMFINYARMKSALKEWKKKLFFPSLRFPFSFIHDELLKREAKVFFFLLSSFICYCCLFFNIMLALLFTFLIFFDCFISSELWAFDI